jgi:hypothetical protein
MLSRHVVALAVLAVTAPVLSLEAQASSLEDSLSKRARGAGRRVFVIEFRYVKPRGRSAASAPFADAAGIHSPSHM